MKKLILKRDDGDFLVKFLSLPKYRVARHILSIGFMLVLTLVNRKPEYSGLFDSGSYILNLVAITGLFYTNLYVLVPRFLFRKKTLVYLVIFFVTVFVVIAGVLLLHLLFFDSHRLVKPTEPQPGLLVAVALISIVISPFIFASTAVKFFQKWVLDNSRLNELETKYLETQLRELRNQINPHFLFNMLNSVNELIFKDPENASQLVIKFSEFLRYNLEETDHAHVLLTKEIAFLVDFVNLEKIRRDRFESGIEVKGDIKGIKVPPKLFINFVENALKHSADNRGASSIQMSFDAGQNELSFYIRNTKPVHVLNKKSTGIGLDNVRRRLELLYGNTHTLTIDNEEMYFSVYLKIPI